MANTNVNKVIYAGQTLIDLTGDDVSQSDVLSGKQFHASDGSVKTGTCTYDADTSDADAVAAEILTSKTAYKNGSKLTGTMPNRGSQTGSIATKTGTVTIQQGYHDGGGSIGIDADEQAKIVATNIRQGVTLLGVEGTMTGTEDVNAQTKSVTPTTSAQVITPDTAQDYNYLAQVNVAAIPYTETDNSAGGKTVTIAAA